MKEVHYDITDGESHIKHPELKIFTILSPSLQINHTKHHKPSAYMHPLHYPISYHHIPHPFINLLIIISLIPHPSSLQIIHLFISHDHAFQKLFTLSSDKLPLNQYT